MRHRDTGWFRRPILPGFASKAGTIAALLIAGPVFFQLRKPSGVARDGVARTVTIASIAYLMRVARSSTG